MKFLPFCQKRENHDFKEPLPICLGRKYKGRNKASKNPLRLGFYLPLNLLFFADCKANNQKKVSDFEIKLQAYQSISHQHRKLVIIRAINN